MKKSVFSFITSIAFLFSPLVNIAQAPPLGTAANFILFSSDGAVGNTGLSQLTGNVGTNNGAITGFGNVNGVMHNADLATAQAAADVLIAYNLLNSAIPAFFPAPLLGNGDTLTAGVYKVAGVSTLSNTLYLDAQGTVPLYLFFNCRLHFLPTPMPAYGSSMAHWHAMYSGRWKVQSPWVLPQHLKAPSLPTMLQ